MLDAHHLTKKFGRLTAVDNLSFDIPPGQAVGLWGANGAGKTTALRCLIHLIPFEGQVIVDGHDVRREGKQARLKVGFVPQHLTFHDDLRVDETLHFYARLKKLGGLRPPPSNTSTVWPYGRISTNPSAIYRAG
ncbi:MAG: ATP-binding cassette domain-containing protein [Chloroflexi bacterium]|nr:ATP-binding cassette domain-containing protein [Chloroflexota bacterium]